MPLFPAGEGPGSNFLELIKKVGLASDFDGVLNPADVPHATTCVAMRFADGVILAGDRRATSGNMISHREVEKVVQADHFSGVAIAGAAGQALEMIKLFALQLEHYEKMEGRPLSLEGKANQLSAMVRGNLPAAMQGLMVIPLFAGFDPRSNEGRLWDFDVTGGRYEEREYVAVGSGSLLAGTVIKLGWRRDMNTQDAISLACRAIWEAADADSATGGPDVLRGVYPIVATITSGGWERIDDVVLSEVFVSIAEEMKSR